MAIAHVYECQHCGRSIETWNEDSPYFLDEQGNKAYAYHPGIDRYMIIWNDSPHLCLPCGLEIMVDSRSPRKTCPKCTSPEITDTWELDRKPCPDCGDGSFTATEFTVS